MPQSLSMNIIHLVYSTKDRQPVLTPEVRPNLFAYMTGIYQQWGSPALIIGGVADHVHALFVLSKNHALSKVVEEVKKGSSKWMKSQGREWASFFWQRGYGAFSVSQSQVPRVRQYIDNQDIHHRAMPFQDEFRKLLRRYRVEFDERYVWD